MTRSRKTLEEVEEALKSGQLPGRVLVDALTAIDNAIDGVLDLEKYVENGGDSQFVIINSVFTLRQKLDLALRNAIDDTKEYHSPSQNIIETPIEIGDMVVVNIPGYRHKSSRGFNNPQGAIGEVVGSFVSPFEPHTAYYEVHFDTYTRYPDLYTEEELEKIDDV